MQDIYLQNTKLFKALSDLNRLMIVALLSDGEQCACRILEKFNITQPTLSHHMKILCDCNLIVARKDNKWVYYSLNIATFNTFNDFVNKLISNNENGDSYE